MKKIKGILVIVLAITMAFSSATVAYAATLDQILDELKAGAASGEYKDKYQAKLDQLESILRTYASASSGDASATSVTIGSVVKNLSSKDRDDFKDKAESLLKQVKDEIENEKRSAGSVGEVRQEVKDMLKNFDIKADTASASQALEGTREVVGTFVGILAYVIVISMGLFTALDIAYIIIPLFRGWYNEAAEGGNKIVGSTKKNGEVKLRWVSDSAVYAVKKAAVEEGKSALKIYFFSRIGAYIAVAIVIFMLLTNNVQIFVDIALKLVSGLIEQLQKIANSL